MQGTELYIGAMSGTSLDGMDLGLLELGNKLKCELKIHIPYSEAFRQRLSDLCLSQHVNLNDLLLVDRELALHAADGVTQLLAKANKRADEICAIGSHGQTIRHIPPEQDDCYGNTLQIGDPNTLAAVTGIPVVADFRRANMAQGGQGAPFAPAFHGAALGEASELRAIVNIGGMANISVLAGPDVQLGYDTGPGNVLMDSWIMRQQNKEYDHDGQWAKSGQAQPELLSQLLAHPYFARTAPKSTGRETFNLEWLDTVLTAWPHLPAEDVQATLLELTSITIADALKRMPNVAGLYICGGGAFNAALMASLQEKVGCTVASTSKLGIAPDLVECATFAWLAERTMKAKAVALKHFAGGKKDLVLGAVYGAR